MFLLASPTHRDAGRRLLHLAYRSTPLKRTGELRGAGVVRAARPARLERPLEAIEVRRRAGRRRPEGAPVRPERREETRALRPLPRRGRREPCRFNERTESASVVCLDAGGSTDSSLAGHLAVHNGSIPRRAERPRLHRSRGRSEGFNFRSFRRLRSRAEQVRRRRPWRPFPHGPCAEARCLRAIEGKSVRENAHMHGLLTTFAVATSAPVVDV